MTLGAKRSRVLRAPGFPRSRAALLKKLTESSAHSQTQWAHARMTASQADEYGPENPHLNRPLTHSEGSQPVRATPPETPHL